MAELLKNLGYDLQFFPNSEEGRINIKCLKDQKEEIEIILPLDLEESGFIIQKGTGDVRKFIPLGSNISFFDPHYYELEMGLDLVDVLLEVLEIELQLELLWVLVEDMLKSSGRNYVSEKRIKALLENKSMEDFLSLVLRHPLLTQRRNRYSFPAQMVDYVLAKRIFAFPNEWENLKAYISLGTLKFLKKKHSPSINVVEKKLIKLKDKYVKNQQYEKAAQLRDIEMLFLIEVYRRAWPDVEVADGDEIFRDLVAENGWRF